MLVTLATVALAFWFRAPQPAPKVLGYTPLTHHRERKFPPLVTDGTRLYFMMPQKTGWTIAAVSASGGETAPIPSHFDDIQLADVSPNGSELLIGQFELPRDVPIYVLPLPAGMPRPVGDIVAHHASWPPDGEQIVYAHDNELYLAKPDGSEFRRLVTFAGPASWPRWSPDGKGIAAHSRGLENRFAVALGSGLGRDSLAHLVARLEQHGRARRSLHRESRVDTAKVDNTGHRPSGQ